MLETQPIQESTSAFAKRTVLGQRILRRCHRNVYGNCGRARPATILLLLPDAYFPAYDLPYQLRSQSGIQVLKRWRHCP